MTETSPATPHLAAAVIAVLEDTGPLEEATGHEMTTSGLTVWQDGTAEAGVWECTPGPSRWVLDTHEVVLILAGRTVVSQPRSGLATWRYSRVAGAEPGTSTRRSARRT